MANLSSIRRESRLRRHRRVRKKIYGTAVRPRLAVHRTNKHFSMQLIDDDLGHTIAAASSVEGDLRSTSGATVAAATKVGQLIAQRAKAAGISTVVYDRGGYAYHGRVAAAAQAARDAGLEF
jgi:large subunit ribosomal protein L18